MKSVAQIITTKPLTHFGTQKPETQKTNPSNPTSSTSTVSEYGKKRIENLFTRFAVFYGHLWRSQFKSDGFLDFAKNEWLEGLAVFSDVILTQAILDCRNHCDMPPTLPQMIGLCRDIKRRTLRVAPEEYQLASKEVAEKHIRQCKAYLFK